MSSFDILISNAQTVVISMCFSLGAAWGFLRTRVTTIEDRVNKLEAQYEPLDRFLGRFEEKMTNIERDVEAIKKKLNVM